jgi:transcriptional regulator with XRE-family HTH domain
MGNGPNHEDFARAFGDALNAFLQQEEITQSEAAKRLGLNKPGKNGGKARLNAYCHDSPKGKRPKPSAEILYLVCAELGFAFEYNGYKISAATFSGNGTRKVERPVEQLQIEFDGQFNLTDEKGTVSISVKRPPGRIAVALSLKGAS